MSDITILLPIYSLQVSCRISYLLNGSIYIILLIGGMIL
nr:MAG TPA: hypothetical protein [Caudoviricetes sp.]